MNDKPTPTPTEADISCATAVARLMFDNSEEVGYECMVCANETIARHVAASVDRATAELRYIVTETEAVLNNGSYRYSDKIEAILRVFQNSDKSRRFPALCEHLAIGPSERLRHAVNSSCDCGGRGPEDPQCCPACKVWHKMGGEKGQK